MDTLAIVVEHLQISLIPWLAGTIAGGGMGYACALGARAILTRFPGLRRLATLLPWRTVLVCVLLLAWGPAIVGHMGFGTETGATLVRFLAFLLALSFTTTTLLGRWVPLSFAARLIATSRTLAAVSVAIAAPGSLAGEFIFNSRSLLQPDRMTRGFLIVIGISLAFDLGLGALQMLASYVTDRKARDTRGGLAIEKSVGG